MEDIIKPDDALLFMKVGIHARESLDDILARKSKEIDEAGYAMWGYGGRSCYPSPRVQSFGKTFIKSQNKIYLCMQEIVSNHNESPLRANKFSLNKKDWFDIPSPINVLGSDFALVINNLRRVDFPLSLAKTKVAIGDCEGRRGDEYVKGRVDKACLILTEPLSNHPSADRTVNISYVAELESPFAVFLQYPANQ